MTRSMIRQISFLLMVLAIGISIMVACTNEGNSADSEAETIEGLPVEFTRLAEVWELLQLEHIDSASLDPSVVSNGAIRGMLSAIDDPYAAFLDSDQYPQERQDIQGFFEGIGAEVGIRDGAITILAPMPDTPAERAGIRPGDVILAVDGQSIQGLNLLEVVNLIRGETGTKVLLQVRHLNSSGSVELEIERGVIRLQSVSLLMQVGQIGHLRLSSFTGTTNEDLVEAIERFKRSKGAGLVVDLRNNPGGLVSSVVDVTSQFVETGLVLYQMDAKGNRQDWNVKSGGKALDIPMVVLVNEFSASASEVFAGAIRDHGRALLIGTATFGKGSVNNLWPLTDGSGVNFTTARWFTPGGTLIEGKGIDPDIPEEASGEESEDTQLDRAIEVLQEQIAKGG